MPMNRSRIERCFHLLLWASFLVAFPVNPITVRAGVRLVAVKPTVLFARKGANLVELVDVTVENTGEPVRASLEIQIGPLTQYVLLEGVKEGKTTYPVSLPDIRYPVVLHRHD
jgi:hypothetical protein